MLPHCAITHLLELENRMKSTFKMTATKAFADGVDVSALSKEAIAAAIKIKLGMGKS